MSEQSSARRWGSQPVDNLKQAQLSPDLFDLIYQRAQLHEDYGRYDPWHDLVRRTGVEVIWHNPGRSGSERYPDALGLTTWSTLRVSLRIGQPEVNLRCTLAHELVHLDRGPVLPYTRAAQAREEKRVHLRAAQRIIDPVVFDALMAKCDGKPTNFQYYAALNCDRSTFKSYRNWRGRVKQSTALQRWEEGRVPPPWPAPWIERHAASWPLAAALTQGAAVRAAGT